MKIRFLLIFIYESPPNGDMNNMRKIEYKILTDNVFIGEKGKYYYFYCITNLTNNKKYWGVHSTNNLDDGYRGSGRKLITEMKTTPISNYHKDILKFFSNENEMYDYEEKMVTKDVVKDNMTYNLHTGGSGSWDFTTGRVTVCDENGKHFLISVDDERYINGNLKHNMVNKIHVINELNEKVTIDKEEYYQNPDKYKTHIDGYVLGIEDGIKKWIPQDEFIEKRKKGEAVGITKGLGVFKDVNGNYVSCSVNDTRVRSGELVGSTKGLTVYKYKNDFSKTCQTTPDDPRVRSGELVGINYGMVNCINPITLEKMMVLKTDKRLLSNEIIPLIRYNNNIKRACGITIANNKKNKTKNDYREEYTEIINLYESGLMPKEISLKTKYSHKKVAYVIRRYKQAPNN